MFDGDEMNIHIPLCIQTVTELVLICNAQKRFISPATSDMAVSAKQDTLMGSYRITYDDVKISKSDALNILMATSIGLNNNLLFDKNGYITGKQLYSQILPETINMATKGDNGLQIVNSEIKSGRFGKPAISNIVKKIWLHSGSVKTQNFIDDLQKMTLQWLIRFGYTISPKDIMLNKSILANFKKIIESKRKEILTMITEYENDPSVMTQEAYEETIRGNLSALQGDLGPAVLNNFDKNSGIYIAIMSKSSGTDMNAGQICAAIGQVIIENMRIQKKFNNRSLPMFNKFDDSAFARGFCHSSFVKGLEPHEFFFQVMAGREGIITTAIKTADKPRSRWAASY